jgi:hypothetical protein
MDFVTDLTGRMGFAKVLDSILAAVTANVAKWEVALASEALGQEDSSDTLNERRHSSQVCVEPRRCSRRLCPSKAIARLQFSVTRARHRRCSGKFAARVSSFGVGSQFSDKCLRVRRQLSPRMPVHRHPLA